MGRRTRARAPERARPGVVADDALGERLAAGVAHELRNPLFAISANLETLGLALADRSDLRPSIEAALAETDHLGRLLLDLELLAAAAHLDLVAAPLAPVVATALAAARPLALECGVRLGVPSLPAGALLVRQDSRRLAAALERLIDNAIRQAPGGEVTVSLPEARAGEGWVALTVSDTGPGFSDEELARVFEPFLLGRRGATGLGLAVARRLVLRHGGMLSAENLDHGGGVVRAELPLAPPESAHG